MGILFQNLSEGVASSATGNLIECASRHSYTNNCVGKLNFAFMNLTWQPTKLLTNYCLQRHFFLAKCFSRSKVSFSCSGHPRNFYNLLTVFNLEFWFLYLTLWRLEDSKHDPGHYHWNMRYYPWYSYPFDSVYFGLTFWLESSSLEESATPTVQLGLGKCLFQTRPVVKRTRMLISQISLFWAVMVQAKICRKG